MPIPSHKTLLLRVLSWHNRHPLARRIKAAQVHGIGELLLPFASAQAQPGAAELAELALLSSFGSALATPSAALPPAAAPETPTSLIETEAASLAAKLDEGEAAIDMPTIDIALFEPPPADPADDTTSALASTAEPFETLVDVAAAASQASAPDEPRHRAGWPLRWLAAIGLRRRTRASPTQPLFSRNIVWPFSAATIARWAQRHGQAQPLLPADAKRRRVEVDGLKQAAAAAQGLSQLHHLHVLSASIVDGDRRLRMLISPTGAVLGSRAYSRPRQTTAASLLMVSMLGAGLVLGGWWQQYNGTDAVQGLLASLRDAPRAAAGDAAAATTTLAANSVASAEPLAAANHALRSAAGAPMSAAIDSLQPVQALAPSQPSSPATLAVAVASSIIAASAPPRTSVSLHAPAPAQAAKAAEQDDAMAAAAANAVSPTTGSPTASASAAALAASGVALSGMRPTLSDEAKRQAREQATQMRSSQQAAARRAQADADQTKAPLYALVSLPSRQRGEAQRSLDLMHASRKRMPPPVPQQGELVQSQGQWRAAWWPFGSLAEAERARVLLIGRGLKAEVVEF